MRMLLSPQLRPEPLPPVITVTRKLCVYGDFAVGKTSLTRRFVENVFSEHYHTTVGVKIDTKQLVLPDANRVKLVIWDLAGEARMAGITQSYLRMSQGLLLVADGTRPATLQAALDLHQAMIEPRPPTVLLLNKADLASEWQLNDSVLQGCADRFLAVYRTSAKTGKNVEQAFETLARGMLG